MTRDSTPSKTELDAKKQLKGLGIDHDSMAALSNVFRVATKFRTYVERNILDHYDLSFTGFTILWITWIRGPQEFKELAIDCGVSKGTLTGIIKTLVKTGYISRKPHKTDGRRLMIQLSPKGRSLISRIFPRVNDAEVLFTTDLKAQEKRKLAELLRIILHTLDE